ncbi:MAG: hypothetical protein ACOCY1_00370 [Halovenus sp.]
MAATETGSSANPRRDVLRVIGIRQRQCDGGVPLGEVVEAAAQEHRLDAALDALSALHSEGEIYQPRPGTIKRTALPADFESFVDADQQVCGTCFDAVETDHLEDGECPGCRYGGDWT